MKLSIALALLQRMSLNISTGASGSPIIAWTDDGAPCFGLHFAGTTETSNYAIAFAAVAALLTDLGVTF